MSILGSGRRAAWKNERSRGRNQARREQRQSEAEKRAKAWRQMSPDVQLRELDQRLGIGIGAVRQRTRILALMSL